MDAIEQIVELERFPHALVHAGRIDSLYIRGRVAGRKHENRCLVASTSDVGGDFQPVLSGQHEIEEDKIIRRVPDELDGLVTVLGPIELEPFERETLLKKSTDLRIVFDK
jgi:hypothetical protein